MLKVLYYTRSNEVLFECEFSYLNTIVTNRITTNKVTNKFMSREKLK